MNIKIRPATNNDCFDIWSWRNHPEARKWSFNSSEISYEEHKEWFEKKIKDENVKLYVAENENKDKLGHVRFDIVKEENKSYININLNPSFLGKGLGNKLIRIATEYFLAEVLNIKEVIAEIVESNIASKKAFEKAGYIMVNSGQKQGQKTVIFSYRK